jgi:thiaminase
VRAGELIERHPDAWCGATRGPFLDGVREGTLPAGAFETWLVQDYLFVDDLRVFQSRLLARSPRVAQAAIAGGLVALVEELGWFEKQAERLGLRLDSARHPTTETYRDFMAGLEEKRYPAGTVALWAIERAFLGVARLERDFWEMAYAGGEG